MKVQCFGSFLVLSVAASTEAFVVVPRHNHALRIDQQITKQRRCGHLVKLSSGSSQFDISKKVFDLFSLRSVRGDALAKYNSLNQSEPLRINLSALLALTFFAAPWLAEELNEETLSLAGIGVSLVAGVGCSGLFLRECDRRSKQLTRLEKELNALSLPIRLPSNQWADSLYQQPRPLGELVNKSSQTVRLLALSGTADQIKEALLPLRVLGRRLVQASSFVVITPTDESKGVDYGLPPNERHPFLADASAYTDQWRDYFDSISPDNTSDEFRWFGISAVGRSFGSGKGSFPEWLQILGQHLRPTEILDEADSPQDDVDGVLAQQNAFYDALTTGNLKQMKRIFSSESAREVSSVIEQGGRLDEWKICLEEGARPAGMKVADSDVLVVSGQLAYSTAIEFPVTDGLDDATLLAVQTWTRTDENDEWKLALHQTIPWSADRPAGGTLICDARGCVALTRGPDRRTFGGIIG